ncbi:E3 ubiquitin-protein ligase neurl1b [Branchiostoma belcheri]|nr:E3 ubiquitin-protein ligase neurl1b [Branchiostoma belcheri]
MTEKFWFERSPSRGRIQYRARSAIDREHDVYCLSSRVPTSVMPEHPNGRSSKAHSLYPASTASQHSDPRHQRLSGWNRPPQAVSPSGSFSTGPASSVITASTDIRGTSSTQGSTDRDGLVFLSHPLRTEDTIVLKIKRVDKRMSILYMCLTTTDPAMLSQMSLPTGCLSPSSKSPAWFESGVLQGLKPGDLLFIRLTDEGTLYCQRNNEEDRFILHVFDLSQHLWLGLCLSIGIRKVQLVGLIPREAPVPRTTAEHVHVGLGRKSSSCLCHMCNNPAVLQDVQESHVPVQLPSLHTDFTSTICEQLKVTKVSPGSVWKVVSTKDSPGSVWIVVSTKASPGGVWKVVSTKASPGCVWKVVSTKASPGSVWKVVSTKASPGSVWKVVSTKASVWKVVSISDSPGCLWKVVSTKASPGGV